MKSSLLSPPDTNTVTEISPADAAKELLDRRYARQNLIPFCTYTMDGFETPQHLITLAEALEAVERGEMKRLMVIMPPRHGKSELISRRFPCWYLARNPFKSVVQAGYAESIALLHSRKARDIFIDPKMSILFPDIHHRPERAGQELIIPERQAASEWGTRQGGSYFAVGIGGGLTGRGYDIGIIDDPVKDAEEAESPTYRARAWEWYTTVFYTRQQPGAAIILVMTRWHEDDLGGRLLTQAKTVKGADQWVVIHMPAINEEGDALWPERYSYKKLMAIKNSTTGEEGAGSRAFEALYQGNPTILEGEIIQRKWWRYYRELPPLSRILLSLDTAFKDKAKNDFSVCTVWGEASNGYYLLDVWRAKVQFPELKLTTKALNARYNPNAMIIEDKASGQSLIQELQRETKIPLLPIKVDSNKVARANAVTPLIESGRVFLPESAPWLYEYIEELSNFPNATHDDQVDSTTQALSFFSREPEKERIIVYDSMQLVGNMDLV